MIFLVPALDQWAKTHGDNACALGRAHLTGARLITVGIVLCHIETPPNTHIEPHATFLTIRF